MKAKIWYLYHSGFAVQTAAHFLVFDYWKNKPKNAGIDSGVIDPASLKERDVVVFASHRHGDHYNREILSWGAEIPKLRLVLSDDIRAVHGAHMIGAGQVISQPDFTVKAFASNDEGVAFLVEIDGLRIFHAGDLNWWHWEGEPDDYNEGMATSYKEQIALLGKNRIDLAFIPVDPRLGEQYAWAIDHLMKTADVSTVVPMHFGGSEAIVRQLLEDKTTEAYRDRIIGLTRRGETAEI
jgi:L-ascorbate metabolism protein UlaG (beta-lactamase superfamily)